MAGLDYLLPFLAIITVVVFFHELGHFWVARLCNVQVDTFSIGFGWSLFSWMDKKGTRWKIGILPLGGYVKFRGDVNAASAPHREQMAKLPDEARKTIFHFKPLWQRTAIVAAGPMANFILAIVIFTALFSIIGQNIVPPIIDNVSKNSAAERAGLASGDIILSVNGKAIDDFNDVKRVVIVNAGQDIALVVERGGIVQEMSVRPDLYIGTDRFGNELRQGRLGITASSDPALVAYRHLNPLHAIGKGFTETGFIIQQTLLSVGRMITGKEPVDALGGPIRIAQISGQMASVGLIAVLNLTAILSVSIGLINLFPIPMLDGGHLLFYAFEAVMGRPLPPKVQDIGMRIGLAMLLLLFVFVTWNDLTRPNLFN